MSSVLVFFSPLSITFSLSVRNHNAIRRHMRSVHNYARTGTGPCLARCLTKPVFCGMLPMACRNSHCSPGFMLRCYLVLICAILSTCRSAQYPCMKYVHRIREKLAKGSSSYPPCSVIPDLNRGEEVPTSTWAHERRKINSP